MSQLEPPRERESRSTESAPNELTLPDETATVSLPDDATAPEAAAVAAAVDAHLRDRRRAAIATAAQDAVEHVDDWVLATRLRSHGKRRWPSNVERGSEWRAAARSL